MGHGTIKLLKWGSVVCDDQLQVFLQTMVAYVCRTEHAIKDLTENQLLEIVVWSLNTLAGGVYPSEDHIGKPWGAKSQRAKLAGKPLASTHQRAITAREEFK